MVDFIEYEGMIRLPQSILPSKVLRGARGPCEGAVLRLTYFPRPNCRLYRAS